MINPAHFRTLPKGSGMTPKVGHVLRRVTPTRDHLQISVPEAVETAMVVSVVVQGRCWVVTMGNGDTFASHVYVERNGLSHPIDLPFMLPEDVGDSSMLLSDYRTINYWPPAGWELVE